MIICYFGFYFPFQVSVADDNTLPVVCENILYECLIKPKRDPLFSMYSDGKEKNCV